MSAAPAYDARAGRDHDPDTLAWALRLVRSRVVRLTLAEFDALPVPMQDALALAGDAVLGGSPMPDDVGGLLAAGWGDKA